jgi:glutathione S-transferase
VWERFSAPRWRGLLRHEAVLGASAPAIGIHILLEGAGLTYDTEQIDVGGGATRRPPLLALNPKGKVPTVVRDDSSVLTEFSAIATWIARQAPERSLLPEDPDSEARSVEVMAYVEGTIHGQRPRFAATSM